MLRHMVSAWLGFGLAEPKRFLSKNGRHGVLAHAGIERAPVDLDHACTREEALRHDMTLLPWLWAHAMPLVSCKYYQSCCCKSIFCSFRHATNKRKSTDCWLRAWKYIPVLHERAGAAGADRMDRACKASASALARRRSHPLPGFQHMSLAASSAAAADRLSFVRRAPRAADSSACR